MADDIPADVRESLAKLLEQCAAAIDDGEITTARDAITSTRSVAADDLPDGEVRDHLLHGCERVEVLLDPDEGAEVDAAGEYVAAMRRRLPGDGGG